MSSLTPIGAEGETSAGKPIRVMIVDDARELRESVRAMLRLDERVEVVGEAEDGYQALERIPEVRPDVVLMDIRMPGESGIEACRKMKRENPEIKVVMLTSYADDEAVLGSIRAGAEGYVLKQVGSGDIIRAIETVARGDSLLDPAVTRGVLERLRGRDGGGGELEIELNAQEERILKLLAQGKTNREIAAEVYLSEKTVRNYVSALLSKTGLKNRAQLAAFAARRGIG